MPTEFNRALVTIIASIAAFGYLFVAGYAAANTTNVDQCFGNPMYSGAASPGHFSVSVTEAPMCTSGNYAATYHLQSDGTYTVRYNTETWFCSLASLKDSNGNTQCLENGKFDAGTINVQNSASVTTYTRSASELAFNNTCGSYETDFSFYYVDNNGLFCRFGSPREPLISTACTTNTNCVLPSPTASPTPSTPSGSPTTTPVPTVSPTPASASSSATLITSGATPTTLPATGPIDSVLFGLLGLIPLGLKLRKSA